MKYRLNNPWIGTPGFNCPGCCPTNERGLKLEFIEDGDDIVSYYEPEELLQSWPNTLHGGIHCLMLDEIAGWVVFAKLDTTGVTSSLNTKFMKPIQIDGGTIELRARITKQMRNVAFIEAELYQKGTLCTKGEAIYFCAPHDKAVKEHNFSSCIRQEMD